MARKKVAGVVAGGVILLGIVLYTQVCIFVVPPIGAVPEGRTLVVTRIGKLDFIDSADGVCQRIQGGVSLLCRGMILAMVGKQSTILMRLPYSETLYLISTGGKKYNR